jgi:hypothetical protein
MNGFRYILFSLFRKTLIVGVVFLGLLSIVGTGSDDDESGGTASNTAPVASIDAPVDATVYEVSNSVTFTGSATDAEDITLTGTSLSWVSSIDGRIGTGSNFTVNDLSQGTHQITLTAVDSKGLASSASVSITVNPEENTLPTATITSPSTGDTFNYGNFVEFTGTGYDTEDLWLTGPSLVWYSNKDGQLGTGSSIVTKNLSGGTHTITLTATDSAGTSDTDSISVIIQNTTPVSTITYPPDGSTFTQGQSIPFNGSGTDTEDGNLTGASLVWTASNYGVIGFGTSITIDFLPAGTDIIINLKAVDEGGLVDSDTITITIE